MATRKILIVDDDIDVITVLSAILTREKYEVVTAGNKAEGLEVARREKPDLAILDVMMTTRHEGFELASEFSKDAQLKKIPILMQTSIDVLVTTKASVQEMAREYRKDPNYKELQVILLKDMHTDTAGIDYLDDNGSNIWVPVSGFVRKPVDAKKLLPELKRLLGE